jgi:hypothetical protein
MNALPNIKLQLANAEMEIINELLAHHARRASATSEQKMIISIIRDMHTRFLVPPYSIPKKVYTKKLKYHEAYTLHQLLLNTSIQSTNSLQYYEVMLNSIIAKIDKQL